MPFIFDEIIAMFGAEHTYIFAWQDTYNFRNETDITKDHFADAVCIAAIGCGIRLTIDVVQDLGYSVIP